MYSKLLNKELTEPYIMVFGSGGSLMSVDYIPLGLEQITAKPVDFDGLVLLEYLQQCSYTSNGDWFIDSENSAYNYMYHGRPRIDKRTQPEPGIGFEVEKINGKYDYIAYSVLKETEWIKEHDGSLPDDGFELISPVYPLMSTNFDDVFNSSNTLKDLLNRKTNTRCGGHINLSIPNNGTPREQLASIAGYIPLLYSMYNSRLDNEYCCIDMYSNDQKSDHYSAIRLHDNRIEFRLISDVKTSRQLAWRANLFKIIVANQTSSVNRVVEMMLNESHMLCKHLCIVFPYEVICSRAALMMKHARTFNYKDGHKQDVFVDNGIYQKMNKRNYSLEF